MIKLALLSLIMEVALLPEIVVMPEGLNVTVLSVFVPLMALIVIATSHLSNCL